MDRVTFQRFPKVPRLFDDVVVTEKIDGTNGQLLICPQEHVGVLEPFVLGRYAGLAVLAGSRLRFLTVAEDNYGFAQWTADHAEALIAELGEGRHFGEWWGRGIQRGYGVPDRRFSLFDIRRWSAIPLRVCTVVPVVERGVLDTTLLSTCLSTLQRVGSLAAPGFMRPEGLVVSHTHSKTLWKVPLDGKSKGKRDESYVESTVD